MKKKIIILLLVIIVSILFCNNVYGYKAQTGNILTYITAYSKDDAYNKQGFYSTAIPENGMYKYELGQPNINNYSDFPNVNYYLKGIWKETIGGLEAYCLDPGLSVADNYKIVNNNTTTFDNLNSDEYRVYTALYKADFSNITMKYAYGSGYSIKVNDENLQYIIKQVLFWAYTRNTNLFGIGSNTIVSNIDNIDYKNKNGRSLLCEDIATALLHYTKKYFPGKEVSKAAENSWQGYYDDNYNEIKNILNIVVNSYKSLQGSSEKITVVKYTPSNEDTKNYQEFIGIKGDDIPPATTKQYAVIDYYDSTNHIRSGFSQLNEDKTLSYDTNLVNYVCTGYDIYTSPYDYGNSPVTLVSESISAYRSSNSSSGTINYKIADKYNVIVFRYNAQPKYTVTYNYYYKSASESGSEYHHIRSGTIGDLRKGAKVTDSIPKTCDSTYNTTLYNTYSISTTVSNLSTAGDYINFDMPASDVTVNIYYQYGQVIKKVYIRNNDGTDTPVGSETKNLTSDQTIGIPSIVEGRGYFIYEQNGSKEYLPTSGNKTISKGKNNVTINLYYARRALEHQHTLKVGNSHRVLETRRY